MVVVSNRVAPIEQDKASAGGLAVAVLAALRKTGGIWFGWSGDVADTPAEQPTLTRSGRLTYATIQLSQRDYDEYYNGYSNSTLWPLFHHRLDLATFDRRTFAAYQRVNELFAARLAPLLQPTDTVWVHDYHLIPCGERLRHMGCRQRLGFFLHTPFPVPEILSALPGAKSLARALCAYDVVGFQAQRDRDAFVAYLVAEVGGIELGDGIVTAFGRTLRAGTFPISIETADIERQAVEAADTRQIAQLRDSLRDRKLIVGVDRLDYSKGLPQRFQAVQSLLQDFPDHCGRVVFMQIAPPTRSEVADYIAIRRELETTAGHINGRFAEVDWTPIRYLNRGYARRALLGFYRAARIGLVTPLRDGMNLVAKEYVAAQDPDDPGVLVLSRFAGAAPEMPDALIVNPYDIEGVAMALHQALTMPLDERQRRYQALMEVLRRNDIAHWRQTFVAALEAAPYAAPQQPLAVAE